MALRVAQGERRLFAPFKGNSRKGVNTYFVFKGRIQQDIFCVPEADKLAGFAAYLSVALFSQRPICLRPLKFILCPQSVL